MDGALDFPFLLCCFAHLETKEMDDPKEGPPISLELQEYRLKKKPKALTLAWESMPWKKV